MQTAYLIFVSISSLTVNVYI